MLKLCLCLLLLHALQLAQPAISVTPDAAETRYNNKKQANYLTPGEIFISTVPATRFGISQAELRTYCFRGKQKTLIRLFETNELLIDIDSDEYTQYEGATAEEVQEHYEEQRYSFTFTLFSQKRTRWPLSTFHDQCVGIETALPYRVLLQQQHIDFWRLIQLCIGLLLFSYAGSLSENAVFYYLTGVTLGICLSFMFLIWLASKLLPRKKMMYGFMLGGWALCCFVLQKLLENIQTIILTYRSYVFWYICLTGMISFVVCYRWGPPENERSKNLIKWCLQLAALLTIYFCSHFEEATAAIIILTVATKLFPRKWLQGFMLRYYRRFPPKRRLLTNEEYYEQGARETAKALGELRSYASSPECKQWRLMSKLKNPRRFADFVEGNSHLEDEEILSFEQSQYEQPDTDDTDLTEEEAELEQHEQPAMYSQSASRATLTWRQRQRQQQYAEEMEDDSDDKLTTNSYTFSTPNNSRYNVAINSSLTERRLAAASNKAGTSPAVRQHLNGRVRSNETNTVVTTNNRSMRSSYAQLGSLQADGNVSRNSNSNSRSSSRRVTVTTAQDNETSDED